jgi:hypothetical protein
MKKQLTAIMDVEIIIEAFLPIWSPIYPNSMAPTGLNKYVEQNANAESNAAVR